MCKIQSSDPLLERLEELIRQDEKWLRKFKDVYEKLNHAEKITANNFSNSDERVQKDVGFLIDTISEVRKMLTEYDE